MKFEEIWNRIAEHQGETFSTKRGLWFTYKIDGTGIYPSRTNFRIEKSDFEKPLIWYPLRAPG